MSGQQVSVLLHECLERAVSGPTGSAETLLRSRDCFPDELKQLLQEAVDRKWPFVEEKWQYKQPLTSEDKMNSSELVRRHLPQLLAFLRDSIAADEPEWAVAAVFLLDRLLYWMDGSQTLLRVARALHRRYPLVPIAPQVVIRQARVYLNTGELRKAEFILSNLINNNASTGSWTYQKASDQTLVQAVSLQVRGQVLQTLGLWLEAAELIWASLIGFYALPQPDKKGIGTSLGLLANILTSMNDQDFAALQKKPHMDLSFLGDSRHRLLSAAQAAKMAVVFSQYGPLYVLTNAVAQGICLLSYSFSKQCPMEEHQSYLALAREAFEIGLLTKMEGDVVTSRLELHTFLKAAFCLATTHRWISGQSETVIAAKSACREALTLFVDYCAREDSSVSAAFMAKIQQIKTMLKVETFCNSDLRSFIPDSYRSLEFGSVLFTLSDFTKTLDVFENHHKLVCEGFENGVGRGSCSSHAQCLTAFQTDTQGLATENSRSPGDGEDPSRSFSHKQNPSRSRLSSCLVDQSACTVEKENCFGSFEVVGDHSSPSNQSSVHSTFGCNKGIQPMQEPTKSSGMQQKKNWNNLEARMFSSSFGSGSSWERVSGRSQSSIETEEDALDSSHNDSEINDNAKISNSNIYRYNTEIQPMQEPTSAEDVGNNPPNTSDTRRKHLQKNQEARISSISSSSSGSSWERALGQSQSSIETQEDAIDSSYNNADINEDAKVGNSSTVRRRKGIRQIKVPTTTEDVEDQLLNTSSDQQTDIQATRKTRTFSSSFGSGSSWERVSRRSQSSIETEEDAFDFSHNEINDAANIGDPHTFRNNREIQSQPRTMPEPDTIEDAEEDPPLKYEADTTRNPRRDVRRNTHARVFSSSFSSRSCWKHTSGQSQSSIETEEDDRNSSYNKKEIDDVKVGDTKGGSISSFSLSGSFGSQSSWQKLSMSPVTDVESFEIMHKKDRTDPCARVFPVNVLKCLGSTHSSTESDPFEELGFEHRSGDDSPVKSSSAGDDSPPCNSCFRNCIMGSEVLAERDYKCLSAGVCHRCLVERLPNKLLKSLDDGHQEKVYDAVVLKYSKASDMWIGCETSVYIGKPMGLKGKQRRAIKLQYLHQEQLLGSYVGKEYLGDKGLHAHLDDVERQMTAQYYVTEFNKRLYNNNVTAQIFFIPSEVLLVLEGSCILWCLSAEPYISGEFMKLTNNTKAKAEGEPTKYAIAFGHFTYEFSNHQEVVVDLQGWTTRNGKGLTYLTDPQIHSLRKPRASSFRQTGIDNFITHQHGEQCNDICRAARLRAIR